MKHMYKIIKDTKPEHKKRNRLGDGKRKVTVLCDECGYSKEMLYENYLRAVRKGDGVANCRMCLAKINGKKNAKHGQSGDNKTPEYISWLCMKNRCRCKSYKSYSRYGGRGIKVCDRWLGDNGFENFMKDMGKRPNGYTLDRIDVDGDYCPENCRWATKKEQAMNMSTSTVVEFNGEKDTITGWAKRLNMVVPSVKYNYENGLPLDHRRRPMRNTKLKGKTIKEWSEELNVEYNALAMFLRKHNKDIDAAIAYYTSPSRRKYKWQALEAL